MTSSLSKGNRTVGIAVTILLIPICFVLSLKGYRKPASLPTAPPSLQAYVNDHLMARSSILLNGSDILEWLNGRAKGTCSKLAEHYTPITEGKDSVDGVDCISVRLKPNLKLRPWIQLWIDPLTGNIRSSREWSAENNPKSVGIRVKDTQPGPDIYTGQMADKRIPKELPEGYCLVGSISNDPIMRHYVYSDGLQVVSIFVGQTSAFPKLQRNLVLEQANTRIYARDNGGCMILCMADLPASILMQWSQVFITQQ